MWQRAGIIIVVVFAVGLAAVSFITAEPQPNVRKAPDKVGLVNLVELMNNYGRTKDLDAELQSQQNKVNDDYQKRLQDLRSLEEQRDHFKTGSPDYERLTTELTEKAFNLRAWRDLQMVLMEEKHRRLTTDIYGEITDAVAKYAKANGYALIIRLDTIDMESVTSQELLEKIRARTIIYSDDAIDITQTLLKSLNAAYHVRAGKKG